MTQENPLQTIDIKQHILWIRNEKVLLDSDLANLYGVETRVLIQAVMRNIDRFPQDFMFQLDKQEFENLRSQFVTSSWGGRRYAPYAFTEQGVAMLSSVLRSKRAIQVNVQIMRTFVRFRQILSENKVLEKHLIALEKKYDKQFSVVFDAIKQLMASDGANPKNPIGFVWQKEKDKK